MADEKNKKKKVRHSRRQSVHHEDRRFGFGRQQQKKMKNKSKEIERERERKRDYERFWFLVSSFDWLVRVLR